MAAAAKSNKNGKEDTSVGQWNAGKKVCSYCWECGYTKAAYGHTTDECRRRMREEEASLPPAKQQKTDAEQQGSEAESKNKPKGKGKGKWKAPRKTNA